MWRTEQGQEHQTVAPSLELERFVIRRLYAQMVGSLSAWHPRRACLIQSTMPMRVREIGNHLNLPAPDGPVSSSSPQPAFVCQITCLWPCLSKVFFPPVPKLLKEKQMSSDGRSRRRELVEEAYQLQVKAGLMARHIPLTEPARDKSTVVSFIGIHISA